MKNSIIIGIVITVLLFVGIGGFMTVRPFIAMRQNAMQIAPIDVTKRLTTFFLVRKINRLHRDVISLQHSEEGRKLLRMMNADET